MVKTRIVKDITGETELCETYSTRGLRLKKSGTELIYSSAVTDIIAGYDENGAPFSRFTYEETNIKDAD